MPKIGTDGHGRENERPAVPRRPGGTKAAFAGTDDAEAAGGVDAGASKQQLYEVAKRLGVEGRSYMTKKELVTAIREADGAGTREAGQD